MNWIRNKLRKWLGIDENTNSIIQQGRGLTLLNERIKDFVTIGVDVERDLQTSIIIMSQLEGGQVRQIRAHLRDLKELEELIRDLQHRYQPREVVLDLPRGMRGFGDKRRF